MGGATLAAAIAGTTGGAGAGVYDYSQGAGTLVFPDIAALSFTTLTIEVWGGGGGGGFGTVTFNLNEYEFDQQDAPGGGGGSGAYSKTIVSVVSGDTGKTLVWSVGTAGAGGVLGNPTGYTGGQSSASSGTFIIEEMICTGGSGGFGGLGVNGGKQGAGGTATGGNTTNTPGNGGAVYDQAGAASIAGVGSLTAGGGGNGGDPDIGGNPGQPGLNGRVRFKFS